MPPGYNFQSIASSGPAIVLILSSRLEAVQEADTHSAQLEGVEVDQGRVTSLKGIRNLGGKFNHCSTDLDFHNSHPPPAFPSQNHRGLCLTYQQHGERGEKCETEFVHLGDGVPAPLASMQGSITADKASKNRRINR